MGKTYNLQHKQFYSIYFNNLYGSRKSKQLACVDVSLNTFTAHLKKKVEINDSSIKIEN